MISWLFAWRPFALRSLEIVAPCPPLADDVEHVAADQNVNRAPDSIAAGVDREGPALNPGPSMTRSSALKTVASGSSSSGSSKTWT